MPHCNCTIKVAFRFDPFANFKKLDDPGKEVVKEKCREEIARMFKGKPYAVAGPMPRAFLELQDDGSAKELDIQIALKAALGRVQVADKKLTFRPPKDNPDPEETIYTVIDGETICEHPYPAEHEQSPRKDWTLDLKAAGASPDDLVAHFFFLVSWGTPFDRPGHA